MEYSFEKLDVWKKGVSLVKTIYAVTAAYPSSEMYTLTGQMKRTVVSVPSNIAEGSSRVSPKDQAHFYQIAYSSLIELLSHTVISRELEFINEETYSLVREQIEEVSRMINSLRKSSLQKIKSTPKPINS